jgi:hypothetical protein
MATLSDATLQQYIINLSTIAREVGADMTDKEWVIKNWTNIKTYLESIENLHTRKSKVCAVLFTEHIHPLPAIISFYLKRAVQILLNAINERYATNLKTKKQETNWVDITDIDEKIDELEDDITTEITFENYKNILRFLILIFHKAIPVRNDLVRTKIIYDGETHDDPEYNYILINEKAFVMNNYKTKKQYGQKRLSLPPIITDAFETYLPVLKHFSPNGYFYAKMNGEQQTSVQFTKLFNSIWESDGLKVGSTQIRRSVITELYDVEHEQKKQELANKMCHSVSTASLIYAKKN